MTIDGGTRLEDVLDRMLAEHGEPSREAVAAYSRVHPEHRSALVDFAARWAEEERLPARPAAGDEAAVASSAIAGFSRALSDAEGPARLGDLARSAGFTLQELARGCGLHGSILTKLDAGRIAPASVGRALPALLGRLLDVSAETARASFVPRPAPQIAAGFLSQSRFQRTETLREALAAAGADPDTVAALDLPD